MYINSKFLIFSFYFLVFQSCQKSEYAQESKEFNNYLLKTFFVTIPEDKSCYLLLPGVSCLGCTKHSAKAFEKNILKPNNYVVTGFLAYGYINIYYENDKNNILLDTLAEILNLKLTKNQVTIVHTDKGNIRKIFHLNTSNIDSLEYFMSYNE